MLIIVEGPDLAGKSSLITLLSAEIRKLYPHHTLEHRHAGPCQLDPLDEYERPLWTYRPSRRHHIICDRWHVGERVYPSIMNRATQMCPARWWHIEATLRARGAFLVHVTSPQEVLEQRFAERGDSYVDVRQLGDIRLAFHTVVNEESTLSRMQVNSSMMGGTWAKSIIRSIIAHARLAELVTQRFTDHVTYVGPRHPALLLLGDTRGSYAQRVEKNLEFAPAFVPYSNTSGHWLLTQLMKYYPEDMYAVGIANACDDDEYTRLWWHLRRPAIVTLGRHADQKVYQPHRALPHPQYQRRFHHHDGFTYSSRIMNKGSVTTDATADAV